MRQVVREMGDKKPGKTFLPEDYDADISECVKRMQLGCLGWASSNHLQHWKDTNPSTGK